VIRTSAEDPLSLVPELQRTVWSLDPTLPVSRVATLSERVSDSLSAPRFRTVVLAALAAAATLLAAIGLYGVLSFVVDERRREIAVRFALGARRGGILVGVLARALGLAGLGLVLGGLGAAAGARTLRAFLFQVEPLDPLTFVLVWALLGLVALLAAWVPAHRAAVADPATALQSE
jgi:ABC-type antimicrobial peptide transport system permease subunit